MREAIETDTLSAGRLPIDPLWADGNSRQTEAGRQELVLRYTELVRIIAAKVYRHRQSQELEYADYVQFGMIGLLESIDRFDAGIGVKFETYASRRINGAILTGIESLSEKQQQIAARKRARTDRTKSLVEGGERGATCAAPSARLERLADVAVGLALGILLEDTGIYVDGEPVAQATPYESLELAQLCRLVASLVERLPTQERVVVRSHYLQQIAFDEISRTLGLTKGRISQIHHAGLKRLRVLAAQAQSLVLAT